MWGRGPGRGRRRLWGWAVAGSRPRTGEGTPLRTHPAPHPAIGTSVPHPARIRNRRPGGKDNHPVGEAAGDARTAFFDGLEPVEPGVVPVTRWRPGPGAPALGIVAEHGGLARKP